MKKVDRSVDDYLKSLPEENKADMLQLDSEITKRMPGVEKVIWEGVFWGGSEQSIIGYGDVKCERPGKETIEWFMVGLARQKNYISVYINATEDGKYIVKKYAGQLGNVKTGSGSISIRKLSDVNFDVLMSLIEKANVQLKD
jgi:hypothetical protein